MNPAPTSEEDRLRRDLLRRIHRRYRTADGPVRLGPLQFHFTRIADPDRVLDEVAEEEDRREKASGRRLEGDSLHLPYWAELWDSAYGVGQFLARTWAGQQAADRQPAAERHATGQPPGATAGGRPGGSPSVLDLGCGMGLAGTVAAALGARVLFADLEPPALLFARLNSLPWHRRVRTRLLNWQKDRLGEIFDLILGADILYERRQWEFLEPFWRAHLSPGGNVLLGEPGRQTGDLFVEWVKTRGWRFEYHEEPVETRARPIRLFRLTR